MYYILPIAVLFIVSIVWIISVRRSLLPVRDNIQKVVTQIQEELTSRFDELSSLLEVIKKYDQDEYNTLKKTIILRGSVTKPLGTEDIIQQQEIIEEVMARIIELAGSNPRINSDSNYLKSLDTMTRYSSIARTNRLIYNDSASKLNHAIRMFPVSLLAGILGFAASDYFEVEDGKSTKHINPGR